MRFSICARDGNGTLPKMAARCGSAIAMPAKRPDGTLINVHSRIQ
jgi:hypothetical protein